MNVKPILHHVNLTSTLVKLAVLVLLALLVAGCSGINMRQSVNPAMFLMPGLGQAAPETPEPVANPQLPETTFSLTQNS
jgi:hypothetical protein